MTSSHATCVVAKSKSVNPYDSKQRAPESKIGLLNVRTFVYIERNVVVERSNVTFRVTNVAKKSD